MRRRPLILALLALLMSAGLVSAQVPTSWTPSEAALELYRNGCPGGGPICDETPELTNGLECWTVEEVTACRPVEPRN